MGDNSSSSPAFLLLRVLVAGLFSHVVDDEVLFADFWSEKNEAVVAKLSFEMVLAFPLPDRASNDLPELPLWQKPVVHRLLIVGEGGFH